jgi:hypothetical protein
VEGVEDICEALRGVALNYFEDGSVEAACPPVKALLHIMAYGEYQGKKVTNPEIRGMFTREAMLASDWYQERLRVKQQRDVALWTRHVAATDSDSARHRLAHVSSEAYLNDLTGTIGADPFHLQTGQ